MKSQIIPITYDRSRVTPGIFHIGVGNFHRSHEAFYIHKLLSDINQHKWGICGGMLLPGDERLYRALRSQSNKYTLTVCGRGGYDEVYEIGSIIDLIWGIEDSSQIFQKLASPSTKILTMTITEGGYNIDKVTGEFNLKDENISHDLRDPLHPRTIFGYVAEGLRSRRQVAGSEGLTILSCDNLQHNGRTACHAFTSFIAAQDPSLLPYLSQSVTFPNSMVDRITPATTPADVARLNLKNGTSDAAPVYCEDFIQWVIEDKFIAGRPLLESVGVEFTNDVSSYESMKLSLLNASHTMLSYPAFLSGYRRVDEAMGDVRFSRYLRNFMDYDITPYVPAPGNINLDIYKRTLIERFSNSAVSDQLSRLCGDGVSKIPIYLMPNVSKLIIDRMNLKHVTFLIASYHHYLKYRRDDRGESYEIVEPWLTERDMGLIASEDPIDFLRLSAFSGVDLLSSEDFVKIYIEMVEGIKSKGILPVLESIIS